MVFAHDSETKDLVADIVHKGVQERSDGQSSTACLNAQHETSCVLGVGVV